MQTIEVNPTQVKQYTQMTKNEILLHISLRARSPEGGPLKRNVRQFAKFIGTSEQRIRDAEYGLQSRGLLRVHLVQNRRWWYVYDAPIGKTPPSIPPIATPQLLPQATDTDEKKRRSVWRKIRDAIVGTRLDDFEL
jgi:hypothetical protein